jgi:diguanylate cyclase (GGDEF)-like protein
VRFSGWGWGGTSGLKTGTRNRDQILRHIRWRSTTYLLSNGRTILFSWIGVFLLVAEVLFALKVNAPGMNQGMINCLWLVALIGFGCWIWGELRHRPLLGWVGYYVSWLALAGVILSLPRYRNVGRSLMVVGNVLAALDMPSQMGFLGMSTWGLLVNLSIEFFHLRPVQSLKVAAGGISIYVGASLILFHGLRFLENLYVSSFSDDLTGIGSRQLLRWLRDSLWLTMLKQGRPISLLLLDIDDFKLVNDRLGHASGDAVLQHFSELLQGEIRHADVFCRYGGDEFIIILPDTALTEAMAVADRLRKRVAEVFQKELPEYPVTVSIGVASHPEHGHTLEDLLAQADRALMSGAKSRGGNRVATATAVFEPDLWEMLSRQLPSDVLPLLDMVSLITGETIEHMRRLVELSYGLGVALGLSEERCVTVMQAAALHDVGKIAIPKAILEKPGPLTWEERQTVMTHSELGAIMLANLDVQASVVEAVRHHHEWWDGTGYPDGLREDQIPIEATILAVVDAYDAMTSPRPYQASRTPEEALQELHRYSGIQFSPRVVALLPQVLEGEATREVAAETFNLSFAPEK